MVSPEVFMKEYIKELLDGKSLANIMNSYELQKYEILKELRNELWELKHFKNYEPKNQLTAMFYQECSMLTITEEPVALFSDTHFGSKDENLEYYQLFINFCIENHITTLIHGGDIGDGLVRYSKDCFDASKQLDYILKVYIDHPLLTQYILGGNHDEKYQKHGIDILKELAKNKRNIIPLGYRQSFIRIFTNAVSIEHSPKLSPEEKIMPYEFSIAGHSHKNNFARNCVKLPTLSSDLQYPNIKEGLPGFIVMYSTKNNQTVKLEFTRYYITNYGLEKEENPYIYKLQK